MTDRETTAQQDAAATGTTDWVAELGPAVLEENLGPATSADDDPYRDDPRAWPQESDLK
ncbi:hypothetical protein [Streptomyces sp. NPDC001492]